MDTYAVKRRVLRLAGGDVRDFLQGLVSNDVARLDRGLVYAAMLTPQGKLIADFFLQADGAEVLMDLPADQTAGLARRLAMYKLRAAVTIAETDLAVSRGTGAAPDGALADPRDARLGWRLIGPEALAEDGTDWDALHVETMVPRWGRELGPDSYLLEMGFERLSGVDFRKGCYVGQEVTARMKHKTELRKGLAQVQLDGAAAEGSEITAGGKPVGVLGTRAGDRALAYLRFDRAGGEMQAGAARVTLLSTG
ncbi:folate-binding protein [Marinovum sp.]|uniref:CAF17-like 4Fe-4S cluster assembly/insertion protein YgfZ n=1 Tax=Marinovum sp. TaxID=2024839 RepID=UPI002B26A92D|nr:folate-binding protein [Marinovum sp.]